MAIYTGTDDAGVFDARRFGVSGDPTVDQTSALQDAIDFCQTRVVSNLYGAPNLILPSGQIVLSSTINWKSCSLIGSAPNNGTRIVWNGSAGGTVIQKWATDHAGNSSFCAMSNINFRNGTAEPGTFLDFTTNTGTLDWGNRLSNVHFNQCSSDAVKVGQWINCHWEHLRFDHIGGYAIRFTPPVSQNLSSFRLDGFTYDHSRASSPGAGVFMVDNSADASNLGTFEVSNGRIEVNTAWAAAGTAGTSAASLRAIVTLRELAGTSNTRVLGLSLRSITYSDASGMADDVVLYRDTANTGGSPTLVWSNVRLLNMSAVLGGNYWSGIKPPLPVDLGGFGALLPSQSTGGMVLGNGARIFSGTLTPEGQITAPIGSLFLRTDGGAATSMYVKESGTGTTGWIAK